MFPLAALPPGVEVPYPVVPAPLFGLFRARVDGWRNGWMHGWTKRARGGRRPPRLLHSSTHPVIQPSTPSSSSSTYPQDRAHRKQPSPRMAKRTHGWRQDRETAAAVLRARSSAFRRSSLDTCHSPPATPAKRGEPRMRQPGGRGSAEPLLIAGGVSVPRAPLRTFAFCPLPFAF